MLRDTVWESGPALGLVSGEAEIILPLGFGPRVLSFAARGGPNFLHVFADGGPCTDRVPGYRLRGGHRLWHAPEDLTRTYQEDNAPPAVERMAGGEGVVLRPEVERATGIRKELAVEVRPFGFLLTHRLINEGLWPVTLAAWPLTMLRRGGYAVVPLPAKGSHASGDLLPTYSIVPWPYTDLSHPIWRFHPSHLGVDTNHGQEAQKLGLTHYPGWSAYWLGGDVFLKHSPPVPGAAYPDRGCAFETFCNHTLIELETLGPETTLPPGGVLTHVEVWGLLRGVARPDTEEAYQAGLRPAADAWLARL